MEKIKEEVKKDAVPKGNPESKKDEPLLTSVAKHGKSFLVTKRGTGVNEGYFSQRIEDADPTLNDSED